MKSKAIKAIILIVCTVVMLDIYAIAMTQSDLEVYYMCDNATGWKYSTQNAHMGTKNTTFKYSSESVRGVYNSIVEAGIDLWGNAINPTYDGNSNAGYICAVNNSDSNETASVSIVSKTNSHTQSWVLTLNAYNFDSNNERIRIRTIAHEFGHVYGLGDLNVDSTNQSKIMYGIASATKNVTNDDLNGMSVVTHSHTHTGTVSYSYEKYDGSKHIIRCSTCKTYKLGSHQWGGVVCVYCGQTK